MDAVRLRPTQLNATARRRYLPVRRVAIRGLPRGARRAASGNAGPCMPAGTFGKTRNPEGTWAAVCPWRHPLALGGLHTVPSDGADNDRRATPVRTSATNRHGFRAASSGTGLSAAPPGASWRRSAAPLCGRCKAPLSACSRQRSWRCDPATQARWRCPAATPCHYGATASSVQAKRVLTTPGIPRPARSPSLSAGTTAGQRAMTLDDCRTALGVSTRPLQDQTRSCLQPLTRRQQAR